LGFIQKLNWLIELYLSTLKSAWKISLWAPFVVYSVLQLFLLIALVSYVNPGIHTILSPVISLAAGMGSPLFGHYPDLFLMLPMVFQWGKLILGIIFEGLAAGVTSLLFLKAFTSSERAQTAYKSSFSRWPQLVITWTCITAVLVLVNWLLPSVFSGLLEGSPRRVAVFDIFLRLLTVFLYAIFIYAVPAVAAFQKSVWGAFKMSFSFFAKYPIFSFFLALVPYLLSIPTTFLAAQSDVIVEKFSPELVFYILLVGIIADFLVNFLTTGAVVKFLIEETE